MIVWINDIERTRWSHLNLYPNVCVEYVREYSSSTEICDNNRHKIFLYFSFLIPRLR